MTPKALVSDALSDAAIQIFKERGVEADFQPNLGKDKDKLAAVIGDYDGLAIRSATKVTPKIIERAAKLRVIGRAGIGVDNVDILAATAKGSQYNSRCDRPATTTLGEARGPRLLYGPRQHPRACAALGHRTSSALSCIPDLTVTPVSAEEQGDVVHAARPSLSL